jgi:hypothetical protein
MDCNNHCKEEQEVICRLQQQLVKLELQYEEAAQGSRQQKLLDTAIDKLKDDIHNAAIDHKSCITACELRKRGCESDGGGGKKSKKRNKARRKYQKIKSRRRRVV